MTARTTELSLDRIVDEAIALLDEEGTAALSMRRLAARLGTSTMSTYHHVADKDALVEAIAERIMASMTRPEPGDQWQDAVRTMAWSFRALTLAHPAAFRLLLSAESPAALLRTAEDVVALLTTAGFDGPDALTVFQTFVRYLIGSTLVDADVFGGTVRSAAEQRRLSEQFRYGLDALIAGIDAGR